MSKIWEEYENSNEIVYVSDTDSYELIYMNKKALDTFGLSSVEDAAGKKCYEIIEGSGKPCTICTNPLLRKGKSMEWRYFNPRLIRPQNIYNTLIVDNCRLCRLEVASDIPVCEHKTANNHNMDKLVNEAIRIALKAPSPDHTINVALEYLGKVLNADRTYIIEHNSRGNDDNTYEWVARGITPEKDNLQDIPPEVCADWYNNFSVDQNITISNVEDVRDINPAQYEILISQNIHSLVVVPLYDNFNRVLGFYGVDNPPAENLEYITDILQIMGHFIVSTLKSRDMVRKLYNMSHHDQLTGFGNRYAMNEYAKKASPNESIGIVYCDITGLKQVNDTYGHDDGDKLIIRACTCISEFFSSYGLFRIGGDELLVICKNIDEAEMESRISNMKSHMNSYSVNMAVGSVWQKNGKINLDDLLNRSETLMRKEKEEYYRASGIERRK